MFAKRAVTVMGTVAVSTGLILAGTLLRPSHLHADDEHSNSDEPRIEMGLQIAPVQLTYDKQNRKLVGLGSYLVNTFECDGCHSAGPSTQYAPGHNPFQRLGPFTPPQELNQLTYLGGGREFPQVGPITSSTIPPIIVSRNLTPDASGLPEGGASFGEFFDSMRRGIDADRLHPNCGEKINGVTITTNCFNPPFNGDLLQVMPWPALQNLTDRDLEAIYEYLKAIPCIPGVPGPGGSRNMTKHLCQ